MKQIEERSINVGVSRKDVLCWSRWIVGVNRIATGLRCTRTPSRVGHLMHQFLYFSIF